MTGATPDAPLPLSIRLAAGLERLRARTVTLILQARGDERVTSDALLIAADQHDEVAATLDLVADDIDRRSTPALADAVTALAAQLRLEATTLRLAAPEFRNRPLRAAPASATPTEPPLGTAPLQRCAMPTPIPFCWHHGPAASGQGGSSR